MTRRAGKDEHMGVFVECPADEGNAVEVDLHSRHALSYNRASTLSTAVERFFAARRDCLPSRIKGGITPGWMTM